MIESAIPYELDDASKSAPDKPAEAKIEEPKPTQADLRGKSEAP